MTSSNIDSELAQVIERTQTRFRRIVIIVIAVPLVFMGVIVLLAVIAALADVQGTGEAIRMLRDLLLVFIALELGLIFLAFAVLLVQVARLVSLLTEEVKPLLESTQDTVQTAQNTVKFAGKNVLEPAIDVASFAAAISVLFGGLFGLRRAYGRATKPKREENGK